MTIAIDTTATPPGPAELVADLVALLEVEPLDRDLYRGHRQKGGTGRVFGGQVIAQGFMAAQRSIDDDKVAHSLHAYFLLAGDETLPIIFRVVRDFDGRSFANRRVIAMQKGRPILTMTVSFQRPEAGLTHAEPMPAVPAPETLMTSQKLVESYGDTMPKMAQAFLLRPSAFEMRAVGQPPFLQRGKAEAVSQIWFRLRAPVPDDPILRRAILAYVSDYSLLSTSVIPHGVNLFDHSMQTASLDHALWFHDDVPLDDWLLYSTQSPWSGNGRGFARGAIYGRDGRLIAHSAQEGLVRMRGDKAPGLTIPHTP